MTKAYGRPVQNHSLQECNIHPIYYTIMLEWNGIQEGGKQVRLHRVLGVGMDTREWKWQVVTQHSSEAHLTHSTHTCVPNHKHTLHTYSHMHKNIYLN